MSSESRQAAIGGKEVERKSRLGTWITAIGAIVLVGAYIVGQRPTPPAPLCAKPVQLVVIASNEKSGPIGDMAADFVRTGATVDDRCIDVKVVRKASGDAEAKPERGAVEMRGLARVPHVELDIVRAVER